MSKYYLQGRVRAINEADALRQIIRRILFQGYVSLEKTSVELLDNNSIGQIECQYLVEVIADEQEKGEDT